MNWIVITIIIIIVLLFVYYYLTKCKVTTAPKKIGSQIQDNYLIVNWDKVEGATKYILYVGDKPGVYTNKYETNENSYKLEKKYCLKYYMAVSATANNCESEKSKEIMVDTTIEEPLVTRINREKNILNVVLATTVPGATGYIVRIGLNPNTYEIEERGSGTIFNIDISKLPNCQDLYVSSASLSENCISNFTSPKLYPQNPPQTVQNIKTDKLPEGVKLTWNPVQDNKKIIYSLESKFENENYHLVGKVDIPEFNFKVSNCGTYYFRIQVLREDGCKSEYSQEVRYNFPKPESPRNLRAN